jgi:hypothetical protein
MARLSNAQRARRRERRKLEHEAELARLEGMKQWCRRELEQRIAVACGETIEGVPSHMGRRRCLVDAARWLATYSEKLSRVRVQLDRLGVQAPHSES